MQGLHHVTFHTKYLKLNPLIQIDAPINLITRPRMLSEQFFVLFKALEIVDTRHNSKHHTTKIRLNGPLNA